MPRIINPADIKVGPGKEVPGESTLSLGGAGMIGVGPHVGEIVGGGGSGGDPTASALKAHINSGKAHPATAIYTRYGPATLTSPDVEGQLDELAGDFPPEPPRFGFVHSALAYSGVPDWGRWKMRDTPLFETVPSIASPNDAADIFPYYYTTPTPTADPEFTARGNDPQTDVTFVSGLSNALKGKASAGGYTRPPAGPGPVPVVRTTAILGRGASAAFNAAIIGGTVYPADRGVLALMHWPPGGNVAAFLAQPLLDRVKMAILLGQGILGKGPCADAKCDGGVGGIFSLGVDSNGDYDPFAYPGQASGQYDLLEIAQGVSSIDGSPLRSPWDDLNADGNPGWRRVIASAIPGPGQVRLGTDPMAGEPVQPYGIPVLGADADYYDDGFGGTPASPLGDVDITPGGFIYFRYRLPYLSDYSPTTGIRWTPGGTSGTETVAKEKARYFLAAPAATVPLLPQAGDYDDFPGNNYTWQIARWRIGLRLKFTGLATDFEEHGTYFFVHFKTETDFEAMARDGVMPDDVTDGYEVFSAWLAPTTAIEDTGNRVNEVLPGPAVFAPSGPAPTYGYKALPYHTMRVNIFEDPEGYQIPDADVVLATSTFSAPHSMQVSGVPYYIPRDVATGLPAATLTVDTQVNNFWQYSYRTDDQTISSWGTTPPALLSSPNPAFVGLAPFAYETGSYTTTVGAAGAAYVPDAFYIRTQRMEIPFTHLDGAGAFSDTDGPLTTDSLQVTGVGYPTIDLAGDPLSPAFTADARARVYLRLPHGNTSLTPDDGIQPPNTGLGFGSGVYLTDTSGNKVLYHSTFFEPINQVGQFANFIMGAPPSVAYPVLETATKDSREFFLDEVYRIRDFLPGIDTQYGLGATQCLTGPGLSIWMGGPIEVPVRIGSTVATTSQWELASFLQTGTYAVPLAAGRLQVAGLPDRNPKLRYGQTVPFPSAGLLVYPHKNYAVGYTPVGPDYSAAAGTRTYMRTFNAKGIAASGQPFLTLRVDGLQLQDFLYAAPGPGTLNSTEGIAILVKVPGLTTWMDIGRADGSGPSKQDIGLDGAGCKVIGPGTFDDVDPETRHVYSQVLINVGPVANLFVSSGIDGATLGDIPILVKVVMNPVAKAFNLEQWYDPTTKTFAGVPAPDTSSEEVRGLIGLRLV